MSRRWWQFLIDILVVLTAVGMAFLIVFAMLQSAQRQEQINQQLRGNEKALKILEELVAQNEARAEEHRESALQQHCSLAVMIERMVEGNEDVTRLVNQACSQSDHTPGTGP